MCDCPKMDPTWLHRSSTGSSQVERLLRKLKTQKETSLRRHRYSKPLNISKYFMQVLVPRSVNSYMHMAYGLILCIEYINA